MSGPRWLTGMKPDIFYLVFEIPGWTFAGVCFASDSPAGRVC